MRTSQPGPGDRRRQCVTVPTWQWTCPMSSPTGEHEVPMTRENPRYMLSRSHPEQGHRERRWALTVARAARRVQVSRLMERQSTKRRRSGRGEGGGKGPGNTSTEQSREERDGKKKNVSLISSTGCGLGGEGGGAAEWQHRRRRRKARIGRRTSSDSTGGGRKRAL